MLGGDAGLIDARFSRCVRKFLVIGFGVSELWRRAGVFESIFEVRVTADWRAGWGGGAKSLLGKVKEKSLVR